MQASGSGLTGNNSVVECMSFKHNVLGSIPTSPISCCVSIMVLEQIANLSVEYRLAGSNPAHSVLNFEN